MFELSLYNLARPTCELIKTGKFSREEAEDFLKEAVTQGIVYQRENCYYVNNWYCGENSFQPKSVHILFGRARNQVILLLFFVNLFVQNISVYPSIIAAYQACMCNVIEIYKFDQIIRIFLSSFCWNRLRSKSTGGTNRSCQFHS